MVKPLQITLAAARVNAGLKQREVAEKLGITKQTLINWEKGRKEPSFANLFTLADIYHIPVDNIILPNKCSLSKGEEAEE